MAWIFTSDGNYVNFNGGGNLWRLHKDSNCISWHWDETGDLFFDVYDQEYTVKAASIGDVIIDSVPLSTASDFKTAIETVFPGLAGGGSSAPIEMTFAELTTAIAGGTLTSGQQYIITDFATKHYIVDGGGAKPAGEPTITGATEPIIVTAIATNKLNAVAKSTIYPQDIIHIDFTESNWTDDVSFSNSGVIIPGWKGTIFFRHDTLLDNYMGYDFRNVKFRRWKTNAAAWSGATTYAVGDFVTHTTFIYKSLVGSNLNNTPALESTFWVQLLDLGLTEYWNPHPTSYNGIPSGVLFDDFKTFSEGTGDATYEISCRSNHFIPFKDQESFFDANPSILSNNVFFLQDQSYYTVFANNIGAEFNYNTIAANNFSHNNIGSFCLYNQISNSFSNNLIGVDFAENIVAGTFRENQIGSLCIQNTIGKIFEDNRIGKLFNTILCGKGFSGNTIGGGFVGHTISNSFQMNTVEDKFGAAMVFTSATHVYAAYNCTLFKRVGGGQRLSYVDASDVVTIVAANA